VGKWVNWEFEESVKLGKKSKTTLQGIEKLKKALPGCAVSTS